MLRVTVFVGLLLVLIASSRSMAADSGVEAAAVNETDYPSPTFVAEEGNIYVETEDFLVQDPMNLSDVISVRDLLTELVALRRRVGVLDVKANSVSDSVQVRKTQYKTLMYLCLNKALLTPTGWSTLYRKRLMFQLLELSER